MLQNNDNEHKTEDYFKIFYGLKSIDY